MHRNDPYKVAIERAALVCSGFSAPECSRAVIDSFIGFLWQPMSDAPKDSTRVILWVPPYGPTTGHYDGVWHLHSVLNQEASPTAWMHVPSEPCTQ